MEGILELNEDIPEIIPFDFVVNNSCSLCNKILQLLPLYQGM
jgi:hypothetical protein